MQKLEEADASVTNASLLTNCPHTSGSTSQETGDVASSLPRHLNDAKNANKRLSRHTDAATSCEEILMTVHTNKGITKLHVCFASQISNG